MIKVPIREVHELELSSLCNLACKYCPYPTMQRFKGEMGWEIFERALMHVEYYVRAGTQGELSLTGIGEAILHPRFIEALALCRETIGPDRLLVLSTNGVAMTPEIAQAMAAQRVRAYVSEHRPEVAVPAARMLTAHGVQTSFNHAFVDSSIDWAGQVDWHVSGPRHVCTYLKSGWAVIRQNGSVDACCQDAHDLHPIATVWDEPGSWQTHAIPLCGSCHLIVPKEMQQEEADVRAA